MKNRLIDYILRNSFYLRLESFLRRIKLGKAKISLYDALVIFIKKLSNDEILDRANGVAFSFTVAIFPAIIFLFTLVPFITNFFPDITDEVIISFMKDILPTNLYDAAHETINNIIQRKRGGLLSIGFVLAVFLSTNGMSNLMSAFNGCYKTKETRGFIKMRIIATGLIFVLALSVIVAVALVVVGQQFLNNTDFRSIVAGKVSIDLVLTLRFITLYVVFQIAISFIYYFAPTVHERWKFLSIGSVFASLSCILASFGLSYYINNFGTYNILYGSIGVLLVLMLWLFILSLILLVGFEMNAAIDKAKVNKLEAISE